MKCGQCNGDDTKVIESRDVDAGQAVRRRRACVLCGHRFTTYERLERPQLVVVKNDGTRQLFNRQKLLAGLYRACEKTPVTTMQLEQLVNGVEQQLYNCSEAEVPSGVCRRSTKWRMYGLPAFIGASKTSPVSNASCHKLGNARRPTRSKSDLAKECVGGFP
jgi:transcriptional regulator NrdR